MGDPNLTRAEAAQRSAVIRSVTYDVHVDLSEAPDARTSTFPSRTRITFECTSPGTETWLDLIADAATSIELNGKPLPAEAFDGDRIAVGPLQTANVLEVTATCLYSRTGEGLHRTIDPTDGSAYLYTQFATAEARRMFACFDQPDLKAPFTLSVTAPAHWRILSNSATPEPSTVGPSTVGPSTVGPSTVGEGLALWKFAPSKPMSTYIMALVAGPYAEFRDSYPGRAGDYPLGLFCRSAVADDFDAEEIFDLTKRGFGYYESVFDTPYPFGKYDQIFVPEFNLGAMENAGCVTFREDSYVFRGEVTAAHREARANVILHEMAHMWFGNLVTMQWWDDLWLNESFAEWAGQHVCAEATAYTDVWATFASARKAWAYEQDQLPSTHPIAADMFDLEAVRLNFDGITYAKGASTLKQLVAWVGQDAFFAGLNRYFAAHAWGNTSLADLLVELEAASGRDLSAWTDQWLRTTGAGTLVPHAEIGPDGRYISVAVQQTGGPAPRDQRIGIGVYRFDNGALVRRSSIVASLSGSSTPITELEGTEAADLLLLNDGDVSYAKVRFDPSSRDAALASWGCLTEPLARAVVLGSLWDMCRDAELPAADFVRSIMGGAPSETHLGTLRKILAQATSAAHLYAPARERAGLLEEIAEATDALMRSKSGDVQLCAAHAHFAVARTPEHLSVLSDLLSGSTTIPGLLIEADIRWLLIRRLVATGFASPEIIDTELAQDPTVSGHRAATTARASIPTGTAKREVWNHLVHGTDITNATVETALTGFNTADHDGLLAQFVADYPREVVGIWERHSPEIAGRLAAGLFPEAQVDPATLAMADTLLAGDLAPGLRRVISEGRDRTARALRCREAPHRQEAPHRPEAPHRQQAE